mgnify:FL=1
MSNKPPRKYRQHQTKPTMVYFINICTCLRISGSGKTSLLNALASRTDGRSMTLDGDININGVDFGSGVQNISGYVQQNDLFIASMTVKEHLVFRVTGFYSSICNCFAYCILVVSFLNNTHVPLCMT